MARARQSILIRKRTHKDKRKRPLITRRFYTKGISSPNFKFSSRNRLGSNYRPVAKGTLIKKKVRIRR